MLRDLLIHLGVAVVGIVLGAMAAYPEVTKRYWHIVLRWADRQ